MTQRTDTLPPDHVIHRLDPPEIAWKQSPFDHRGLVIMCVTFLAATAVTTAVGLAIVRWWEGSSWGEADADVNRWLEDWRNPDRTTIAEYASQSSDTITKIIFGVVMVPVFLWLFRRWHEYALVFGGLILEVMIFGLSSELVARDRPPVEQLDGAPTNSFPSGHIAAATVFYCGLAVVIFMRTKRVGPRIVGAVLGVAMTLAMVGARLYLGMHYLSDAVAGVAIGVLTLIVMYRVVHRTLPDEESPELHDRLAAVERAGGEGRYV